MDTKLMKIDLIHQSREVPYETLCVSGNIILLCPLFSSSE